MRILFVGDVFSVKGREILARQLKKLRQEKGVQFIVVNGENIAHGHGINEKYYHFLLEQNVNVVTLGNHAFRNHDIFNFIEDARNLIRPLNFPSGVPGQGFLTVNYNGKKITVFQVMGRIFENIALDCPFQLTEQLLKNVKSDLYFCDFHGEATSEKAAFAHHFDGRVHIVVGTHTHVQTNDARILPKGTMFITDLGMTGSLDGIIGVTPQNIIKKFLTGLPARHDPMEEGRSQFNGLFVELDDQTQKVTNFEVIHVIE